MKRRIISLMLLTSLLATTLVGCGNDKDNTPVSEEKNSVENTDNAEESQEDVKEPVTLTWLGVDRSSDGVIPSDDPEKGWKNSEAGKKLVADLAEMNINLEMKWVMFDNNTYPSTISTRVGTGVDMADIGYVESYTDNVNTWGRYGFVEDLLPLLEQYDEDGSIKQYFYDHGAGAVWENAITEDGHLYYFPNINTNPGRVTEAGEAANYYFGGTFYIRKDWVEALGYECKEIYTPDEILDLVIEMREKDVNGDGKHNEHIYSKCINSDYAGITHAFRLSPYGVGYVTDITQKEAKVVNSFESEYFDDFVDWIHRAMDAGVYNANYLAGIFDRDNSAEAVAFENGYGMALRSYPNDDKYGDLKCTYQDYVPIIVDVEGTNEGCIQLMSGVEPSSNHNIFISSLCEDLEAAINMLDYMYTDEFTYLCCRGVEGPGYTLDAHGFIQDIADRSSLEGMLNTLGLGNMGFMAFPYNQGAIPMIMYIDQVQYLKENGLEFNPDNPATWSPEVRTEITRLGVKIMNEYSKDAYHLVCDWPARSVEDNEYLTIYGGQTSTAMSEYMTKFLTGDLSVEDDLDNVIKELYDSYNLQGIIDANVNTLKKKYTVVE